MFGVPFDDILFNGKTLNVCEENRCLITFDSGTSLMSMPTFETKILSEKGIPTLQETKKCKSEKQFGSLTFIIGGKKYELSNGEWMFPA